MEGRKVRGWFVLCWWALWVGGKGEMGRGGGRGWSVGLGIEREIERDRGGVL